MKLLLLVGVGSFLGGILRYLISVFFHLKWAYSFPMGTFLINLLGCLLIGVFYSFSQKFELNQEWRLFLTTGLLGGFTTFSAFSIETVELLKNQHFLSAFLYVTLSISLGLSASAIGIYISR